MDALRNLPVSILSVIFLLALAGATPGTAAENKLAVLNAGVSSAEDAPFVASDYRFLPGDYLYVTFEISGFAVRADSGAETRKIAMTYEVVPEDESRRPLVPAFDGDIKTDLSPEDKNWIPKRRASFLLPSFVAAGSFHVRVSVKDLFGASQTTQDVPFQMGGVHVKPANSITVEDFQFFRSADDTQPLSVPAYSPGDIVHARFQMTGYRVAEGNRYHVAYSLLVLAPDGKPFIQAPEAANLTSDSFYPAQFVPGTLALQTKKESAHGEYVIVLTVRDLLGEKTSEIKQAFSIE